LRMRVFGRRAYCQQGLAQRFLRRQPLQ
jgi:hypothetical protein